MMRFKTELNTNEFVNIWYKNISIRIPKSKGIEEESNILENTKEYSKVFKNFRITGSKRVDEFRSNNPSPVFDEVMYRAVLLIEGKASFSKWFINRSLVEDINKSNRKWVGLRGISFIERSKLLNK